MSMPENIGSKVAAIKLKASAFTPLSDHVYLFNAKKAGNPVLGMIIGGFVNLLDDFVQKFHGDQGIAVTSKDLVAEKLDPLDPFVILIVAKTQSGTPHKKVVKEFQVVMWEFAKRVLKQGDDLVSKGIKGRLSAEQVAFLDHYAEVFVRKNGDRTITDPLLCEFPGQEASPLPIQDRIKSPVRTMVESEETTFLAQADGARGSELQVFLKRVDESTNKVSAKSEIFIAESYALTLVASAAHADNLSLVRVTAYTRTDEKGKQRQYLKAIEFVKEDELAAGDLFSMADSGERALSVSPH